MTIPSTSPELEAWAILRARMHEAACDPIVNRSPSALLAARIFCALLRGSDTSSKLFVHRAHQAAGRFYAEKSKRARRAASIETARQVKEVFLRLQPSQQGRGAASIIATSIGKSTPTVRAHLRRLGLYAPSKRK